VSSFYVPAESLLQSRAFRRLLAFSLAGHLLVLVALVLRPSRHGELIAAAPVMVQVVQMPKAAVPKPAPPAAKPPPPKPEEKPPEPPPPPKPVVKEIVIPKEPAPLPAKPKPAPPVETKPKTPPPSADELIAKMTERVEAQEAAKAPPQTEPQNEAPAAAVPSPGRFDPIYSPWIANVKARVNANWTGASVCTAQSLFDVDIAPDGRVTRVVLTQSSGDASCDGTAERAIKKSSPLPPPPQAATYELGMDPKDLAQ
jgi:colicin import membrane protein